MRLYLLLLLPQLSLQSRLPLLLLPHLIGQHYDHSDDGGVDRGVDGDVAHLLRHPPHVRIVGQAGRNVKRHLQFFRIRSDLRCSILANDSLCLILLCNTCFWSIRFFSVLLMCNAAFSKTGFFDLFSSPVERGLPNLPDLPDAFARSDCFYFSLNLLESALKCSPVERGLPVNPTNSQWPIAGGYAG